MPKGDENLKPLNKNILDRDSIPVLGVDTPGTSSIDVTSISKKRDLGGQNLKDFQKSTGTGASILGKDNLSNKDYFNNLIEENKTIQNDIKAYQQSTADKIGNGIVKFGGRVFTSMIGSTAGTIYGLYAWARDGEFRSFYDNEFQDSLDGINDYLAEEFKHYYTSDPNDWEVGNFIFDKVFDGLGFAVGAVGSSMIGGGATNALTKSLGWSKYLKAGAVKKLALAEANAKKGLLSSDDLLKSIDKYNKSITRIDKLSKIPHTTAQMTTGAVYESGVEARHTFDEIREELVRNYKAEFGYEPKGEALKNITEIAGESANGVFAANMALVGSSNFIQFGRHLGLDYQDINKIFGKKALAKVIETREGASQLSTKFAKRGSAIARGTKTILKNPVMESQEEMLQSVISETGKDYAKKKYNNDGKADLKDLLDSSVKSFKGVYTSKEGWEEGLLGAIVGSIGVYNASKKADGSRRLPSLAVIESVKDWRSDENFRNSIVQMLNDNDVASSLTAGLEHTLRDGQLERAKDGALALNRQREYKDAEDEQFHSYVMSRIKAGMYSQIGSELNTLRNTPLDEFKDMFGISQEVEYTETDKLKQIESFERRAKAIEESNKFITSNYSQLEDFHDELIFDHAMVKRITERRDNIAKQINDLTGQAVVTLNVTDEETGKRIPATEVFKDVDAEHKINEDIYTGLYNDYVALDKKQKAHLDNFKEVISNKEARDERLNEQEAVQKDAEKQANKVKRKKEKTQAKAKEEERANQSDMIAKAEEDDLLENSQVLFEEEAALKELDDLEVVTPEDSVLKEALAKDKDAREKVNDAINNKVKDKSGVNPDTPSDERTDYQRDKEINEQSDDTKVAPKDYTKDTKTKKNVEEEIAKANRGQVTEGYENEEVQKETTGVYRIGKRLVYAYNAIAVRTRNFIETATGIKESSDKIDTHTSLDILHPDLIKAGDKVEITLNNDSEIIFNDANGEPQTYKNEVGTPNQVMEIRINDKLIGYLHDLTYITENRVVPIVEGKNNIQANIDALTNVRQNIFNELQTKQSYQVTVTSKTAGQIRVKVNEKYDSPLTETIANDTRPQILVVKDGTIYHNAQPVSESWLSDELLFDLEESHKSDDDLTFAEKFNGATLIAVPGANGKYIMSLVRNGSVQESNLPIRQTVLEILDAYINQDIEKLAEYGLSDVENNEMYDELISQYINKFIYTNSSLDNPYYMYLGISDNNMPQIAFKDKEGNGLVYTGNTESVARKKLIDRIDNALISTNLRALVDKETVRLSNGKEMSYQEFLHNNLYANFVGENINTSKGTIRSYTDNPIISLDFEDNHVKFGKKLPAKKDRPTESELLDSITEKSETQVTDIETQKADIEKRRQEELDKKRKPLVKGLERIEELLENGVPTNEKDAGKVLNEISRARKNISRGSVATQQELNKLNTLENYIKDTFGLEIVEVKPGTIHNSGNRVDLQNITSGKASTENVLRDKNGEIIGVYTNTVEPQINKNGVLWQTGKYDLVQEISQEELDNIKNPINLADKINAKYDAELAALEGKTKSKEVKEISKDNPFLKSNFKRSKKSPKKNFKPEDLFKNLNPIIDADKGTLLPTKHVRDITMSLVNTAYNIIQSSENKSTVEMFKTLTAGLQEFGDYYESIGDTNGMKAVETVLNNFDAFKPLVAQRLRDLGLSIKGGKVSEILFNAEEREEVFTDAEEDSLYGDTPDVTKSYKEDGILGDNPIDKLSYKIKVALATIPNNEANILGMDSYYEMETVYNSIMEVLANIPDMSIEKLIEELKANSKVKPYLEHVAVNILENPETETSLKYMLNSHFKMAYITKELAKANDSKDIKIIESNRVALSNLILEDWLNNGNLTNLFNTDESINSQYVVEVVQPLWAKALETKTIADTKAFLNSVGIAISTEALEELRANSKNIRGIETSWDLLFTHKNRGVFKKIREALNKEVPEGTHPLSTERYVRSLASVEARFKEDVATKSSRDVEGNSIFSYIVPTFITDRFNRLKDKNGRVDRSYVSHLRSIPFLSRSWYLEMLADNKKFRDIFRLSIVDSLKVEGIEGKKFNNLTEKEQIIGQIAYFVNGDQGDVDGKISKFFVAKSDKSILHLLTALRHRTTSTPDKIRNNEWSEEDKRQIIDNIVGAEYSRIKDAQERESKDVNFDDIKGYNPFLFYSFSELNHLSQIRDDYGDLINFEDAREVMWQAILPSLKDMHDSTKDKLEKFGIIDSKGKLDYVDKNYIANNFKGDVDYFVRDYTLNYMIATSNYTQIFQGDVAFAYKEAKQKDYPDLNKAELIDKSIELAHANMFKRLAKDMAPAVRSASSIDPEYAEYSQIVLADAFNSSLNIEQLKDIFGEDSSTVNDYSSIEGTDAQEVTLLAEHINVMYHHGKLTDEQYNRFYPTAKAGRDYSPEDLKDLIEVLKNPMKPVFVQNQYMDNYGAEVPVYIKTSSFPLVPQLVKGTAFETLEKIMRNNKISRAAFASGVKLGAFKTIDAWNKKLDVDGNPTKFTDGTFNEKELNRAIKEDGAVLRLNRDYFGIQQEVPYDANKKEILEGTPLMKLIQGGISDVEVLKEFNQLHIDIVEKQLQNLLDELEVVDKGDGKYTTPNLKKLRTLLREELIERGSYNENDLAALEIREVDSNGTLEFNTPLWANPKSVQFESLLNSIINKRVLKSKIPGKSYVLGTEEGWLGNSVEIQKIDERKLVGTRYNSKKGLRPQRKGYVNKTTGEKLEYEQYKALSKKDRDTFDEVVFPAQVLMAKGKYTDKQMIGYRIPTQGLNSMSAMEVVGYLPDYMGDLLIAPRDFTKQMGSDFDIDKIYVHRWHETRAGNRTSVETTQTGWKYYQEEREQQILKRDVLRTIDQKIIDMFNNASIKVNGEKFAVEVETDDLKEYYDKIVTKTLTEEDYKAIYDKKIKQNRIMTIYWDTLTDPNNLKAILKPLDFGNLPEVIKNLKGSKAQHTLSPLRQIENYQNGNAGKFGVAVTSHASTTNALIQVQTSNIGIRGNTGFAFIINGNKKEPTSFMGKETLNGKSTKADVISAFQSASVDNIKELLINIINYNKHTHDAFITLAYLGLDDTYISYLLAQPIIKDFVANKEALSSAFEETRPSEIDDKAYAKTFEDLGLDLEVLKEYRNLWNKPFSEEQLLDAINNPEDIESQVILLAKFKELSKVGKEVNELIRALQPATSGIGKNRIAAETKQSRASTILKNSEILYGVGSLFGKIQGTEDTGVVVINPTTIAGQGYEVLRKSNNLLNKLFPINTIGRKLSEAIAELQGSYAKYFTEKQLTQMTKFAKSYLFSYALDLYGKENAAEYRKRLMIGDNTLAHRWEAYKKENPKNQLSLIIRTKVSKDPLKVSTINYNAATADRTDDIKNVTSLLDMLATGTPLEKELAEDTIAYTYLTGGNQDASSLLKFIPNTYLSLVNLGKEVNDLAEGLISGDINFAPLTKQFLQHYPYFVETGIGMEYPIWLDNGTILLDPRIKYPRQFVSIRTDKSRLYELTTEYNDQGYVYKPVDNLGTYLYSEANFGELNTTSINPNNNVVKAEVKEGSLPVKPKVSVADVAVSNTVTKVNNNEAKYRIDENSAKVTLDIIASEGITEEYRNLAKALSSVIGNTKIQIGSLYAVGANGAYNQSLDSITIDKDLKDSQEFERVVLHEAMHAVLADVISNPTTKEQKNLLDSLQAVLNRAQNSRDKFSDKNGLKDIHEFISELMTDYTFQQELTTVEFGKDESLLDRIWNIVKDFFNVITGETVTKGSITKVGKLLETLKPSTSIVSKNTQDIIDSIPKEIDEIFAIQSELEVLYIEKGMAEIQEESLLHRPEYLVVSNIPKLDPESVKQETGLKIGTNKDINPNWLKTGGNTINKAAHDIWEDYFAENNMLDTEDIRNIIIEAVSYPSVNEWVKANKISIGLVEEIDSKIKKLEETLKKLGKDDLGDIQLTLFSPIKNDIFDSLPKEELDDYQKRCK